MYTAPSPILSLPFLAVCLASTNCTEGDGANASASIDPKETAPMPKAPSGSITVRIVDAPADVKEVWVVVDGVSFKRCKDEAWTDHTVGGLAVDLIAVAGDKGNFAEVLSDAELDAGNYCRLRLVLAESGHYVVLKDDSVVDLKVPSGDTSGLKGLDSEFYVAPGVDTILTIDFDAAKSLVENHHGERYILKPVLDLDRVQYYSQNGQPLIDGDFLGAENLVIDASGGQFVLADGATLTVPPGALLAPVEFVVNRWRTDTVGTVSDIYQFLPDIRFEHPVDFTFPYDPDRATSDDLFVFDDSNIAPASFDAGQERVAARFEHFSQKYGVSSNAPKTFDLYDENDYALPEGACNQPAQQHSECMAGYDDGESVKVAIECLSTRPFSPSCTELVYRDLPDTDDPNDELGAIKVTFTLTEEEIYRVRAAADSTIEWQLKFYKQKWLGCSSFVTT